MLAVHCSDALELPEVAVTPDGTAGTVEVELPPVDGPPLLPLLLPPPPQAARNPRHPAMMS